MSDQQTLTEKLSGGQRSYHIFYREIKDKNVDLTEEPFRGENAVKIDDLLKDIFTTTSGDPHLTTWIPLGISTDGLAKR